MFTVDALSLFSVCRTQTNFFILYALNYLEFLKHIGFLMKTVDKI